MNAPTSRRPLSSRNWGWVQGLAAFLARAGVSPNAISVFGLACGLLAGMGLAATGLFPSKGNPGIFLLSAALIQMRLLANLIDGLVAVEGGKRSPVGGIYNELPDRVTDAAIFIGAGYAAGGISELGWFASVLAIIVAYLRALGVTLGAGEAFLGIMAKPQRMFFMTIACVGSAFAPSAFKLMGAVLGIIIAGCVVTFFQRLLWISKQLKAPHE